MFCSHRWELLESHRFDGELEKFKGADMPLRLAESLSTRGVISVVQCVKCGVVKHIQTVV